MINKKNLSQWLEYLESIHPSEIEMGLERVRSVATAMNLIKPAKKVVLVAGTNGKGSTVTFCSCTLIAAGFSVGTYMSPHLKFYNERVKINNKMVSDEDVIESFEAIEAARGDVSLTYFEFGTLSSFYLFKKFNVDCAVIEVGLGGRLDATNIVEPDVSVVTSVGLDHQDWLGDDLSVIAFEKAGVYRSGKPAICGQVDVSQSLVDHADSIGSVLFQKNQDYSVQVADQEWSCSVKNSLGGVQKFTGMPLPNLPLENAGTALQALIQLLPELQQSYVEKGFEMARLPGRMERFDYPFKGVMDVGHNPQASQMLAKNLSLNPVAGKRYGLLAMLSDKDAVGVVDELRDVVDSWCFASINGYRGQTASELQLKVAHLVPDGVLFDSVDQGMEELKKSLSSDDELLVFGSFFTVADAQDWLKGQLDG